MEITKEEATKGIGFLSPRKASPKAKATRARKRADKATKIATRRANMKALREAVMERAAKYGGCEGCGGPGVLELHHLEGGSGRRREKQWIGNCMGLCGFCHREYHRDPETLRQAVLDLCVRWQYPVPSRFIREPRAQRAPQPNPGQTHYVGDSCPGGHAAPEFLPERIAK